VLSLLPDQTSPTGPAPEGGSTQNRGAEIATICNGFVSAWLARPRLEDYLQAAGDDATLHDQLLVELLLREFTLLSRDGIRPNLDDCLRRFPQSVQPVSLAIERWYQQQSVYQEILPPGNSSATPPLPQPADNLISQNPHMATTRITVPLPSTLDQGAHTSGDTSGRDTSAHDTSGASENPPDRDFELIRELGRGASGVVHLAHQVSLGRNVALKVTRNMGSEARTMASLEHPHIVQVFSEHVDSGRDERYLCMQYVCGATLSGLIAAAQRVPRHQLSGARLIELLEELSGPVLAPPSSLANRDRLMTFDYYQAVCWIACRLAEALAYAHSRNVLHRDIKPANVLVDRSGRPFLADFSLALNTADDDSADSFGGTLPYMAPEHLNALDPSNPATSAAVDHRSDVYSLGMALREFIILQLDHDAGLRNDATHSDDAGDSANRDNNRDGALGKNQLTQSDRSVFSQIARLAVIRSRKPEPLRYECEDVPEVLDRAIVRSLAPAPADRYPTAAAFAQALQACSDRMQIDRKLPKAGYAAEFAAKRPFIAAVLTSHLPHLIGAAFCPAYNAMVLFERFTFNDKLIFALLPVFYCLAMFPLQALAGYLWFYPATRTLVRLRKLQPVTSTEAAMARRRCAHEPMVSLLQSVAAWLPLTVYVPAYMYIFISPMSPRELLHLMISVVFSILMVSTFSFLVLQYYTVRVWYPALAVDAVQLSEMARKDLQHVPARARLFHFLALLSPLLASVLLLGIGPAEFGGSGGYYLGFRALVVLLILLGLSGAQVSFWISTRIVETVDALTAAGTLARS